MSLSVSKQSKNQSLEDLMNALTLHHVDFDIKTRIEGVNKINCFYIYKDVKLIQFTVIIQIDEIDNGPTKYLVEFRNGRGDSFGFYHVFFLVSNTLCSKSEWFNSTYKTVVNKDKETLDDKKDDKRGDNSFNEMTFNSRDWFIFFEHCNHICENMIESWAVYSHGIKDYSDMTSDIANATIFKLFKICEISETQTDNDSDHDLAVVYYSLVIIKNIITKFPKERLKDIIFSRNNLHVINRIKHTWKYKGKLWFQKLVDSIIYVYPQI